MAEKPKLKEADEILSSIGKRGGDRQPDPAAEPGAAAASPEEGLIDSPLNTPPARRRRRAPASNPAASDDARPLDFGKYQLPVNKSEAAEAAPEEPSIPAPRRRGRPPKAKPQEQPAAEAPQAQSAAPEAAVEEAPAPAPRRRGRPPKKKPEEASEEQAPPQEPEPRPVVVKEYKFEELGDSDDTPQPEEQPVPREEEPSEPPPAPRGEEEPAPEEPKRKRGRPRKNPEAAPAPEMTGEPGGVSEASPKRRRGRPPKKKPEEQAVPPQEQAEEAEDQVPERDDHRENFLKRLSSQFEQEFTQRFEDRDTEQKKMPDEPSSWFDFSPKAAVEEAPLLPEEEREVDRETEEFFQEFEKKAKQEEEVRAESFKDTLAEKFERERERYLQELGIGGEEEEPEEELFPEEPSQEEPHRRRVLDLHIQPEMHRQGDEPARPVQPMTYGPGGVARPQTHHTTEDDLPYTPTADYAYDEYRQSARKQAVTPPTHSDPPAGGKKSSEQLLLELAAQNSLKGVRDPVQARMEARQAQEAARKAKKAQKVKNQAAQQQEEEPKKKGKAPGWTSMAIASVAVVLVLALGIWQVLPRITGRSNTVADAPEGFLASGETLTAYEDRHPTETQTWDDVIIKKSGISLSNMLVNNHVVIGDITTQGHILLQDMNVGGTIYVQGCAVDSLLLENVVADRVIINNAQSRVTVQTSGATAVGTVEMKTPGSIIQGVLSDGYSGVDNVQVKKAEEILLLDVALSGVSLRTLTSEGESQITLSDGSQADTLQAEGAIILGGDGKVKSLTASLPDGADQQMVVRLNDSVSVNGLRLRGAAQLSMSTAAWVETVTTESGLSLDGDGNIGDIFVNPGETGSRLPMDFTGSTVNAMFVEGQATIRSSGANRINSVTANHSVYLLGNKVNHLTVGAPGVIYETEPDKITLTSTYRPETVADNPNLDFSLVSGTSAQIVREDGESGCDHLADNGGFVIGDGSVSSPFEVTTPAQLAHVSMHPESHFVQMSNINLAEDSQFASGFTPIASEGRPFSGSYNGNGFTITNLRINGAGEHVGLFAENTGTILNVHVISGEIRATRAAGSANLGGIVGFNYQGGLVEACANGARVTADGDAFVGGVVGYNFGAKVRDSYNYAKVTGSGHVGGVVGYNSTNASLVGSYNAGTIDALTGSGAVVGTNDSATIVNCYYLADTDESGIGSGTGTITRKTSDELSSSQMAMDLAAGDDNTPWTMPSGSSYTYPVLRSVPESAAELPASASSTTTDPGDLDDIPDDPNQSIPQESMEPLY